MKIPELSNDLNIISKLGDNPGADDGLTAEGLKAKFDEGSLAIQQYINGVLIAKLNEIFAEGGQLNEGLIMTGPINMNQQMLFGLKNPVNDSEPVNLGFAIANYAPKNHVDNKNNPHGVTAEQTGAAPTGFGLGLRGGLVVSDCNNVYENGFYTTTGSTLHTPPFMGDYGYGMLQVISSTDDYSCVQIYHQGGYHVEPMVAIRKHTHGEWKDWEFDNPPMFIGVEYRTTERYNGKAVYTKAFEFVPAYPSASVGLDSGVAELVRTSIRKNSTQLPYLAANGTLVNWAETSNVGISVYSVNEAYATGTIHAQVWYTKN